jgi:hypothetical protein
MSNIKEKRFVIKREPKPPNISRLIKKSYVRVNVSYVTLKQALDSLHKEVKKKGYDLTREEIFEKAYIDSEPNCDYGCCQCCNCSTPVAEIQIIEKLKKYHEVYAEYEEKLKVYNKWYKENEKKIKEELQRRKKKK